MYDVSYLTVYLASSLKLHRNVYTCILMIVVNMCPLFLNVSFKRIHTSDIVSTVAMLIFVTIFML